MSDASKLTCICIWSLVQLDADEFESIKEEIQLRRQRERFPTQAKARARAAKEGVKPSMEPDEEKKQAELQESSSSEEDDYEPPVTRSGKRQKTSATTMREVKTPARHRVTADPKPSAAAAAAAGAPAVDRAASHQKRLERQAENFGYLNAARHSRRQQLAGRLAAKLPSATAKLKVSTTSVGAAASSSAAPSAAAAEPHAAKLARLQAEVDRLVTVWMGVHVCKSVQEEDDEFDLEARAQAALDALRLPDPSFDDESPSEEQNDSAEGEKRYDRLHFEFSLGDAPVINMPLVSQTLVTPSSSLLQPSSNESRSVVTTALPPSLPPRPFYPPSEASTPMELCSP